MKEEKENQEEKEVETKETKQTVIPLVLNELPTEPTRRVFDQEGKEYQVVTRDEALTEILQAVREIKKGVVG